MAQTVKNLPAVQETWVRSLGWEDPLEKKWQPTQVLLPGKSHGWRILVDYSPWDCKELGTRLSDFTFMEVGEVASEDFQESSKSRR